MTTRQAIISILVMAAITAALRCGPFLVFSGKSETPPVISYLGRVLPYAIMGMLVVYCLRDVTFSSVRGYLPQIIASAVVVGLHAWKRNTLLSIVSGTVTYMALVQLVFK